MKKFIAENIKNARENANLRQVDVKEKTGINNKSLSNWEKGVAYPCLEDLIVLADLYGISIDSLIGHRVKEQKGLSLDEKTLIVHYRKLNDKGKTDLLSIAESFSYNPSYTEKRNDIAI